MALMVSSGVLCLHHLFSRAGAEVLFHPTGFSKVWELCTRYNLSLRAQPTQSAEDPNYAPCFNEPCNTLSHPPRPISSFPAGLLSPAASPTSSVFPVGVLLGVVTPPLAQSPAGRMCDKPRSCWTPGPLLRHSQGQLSCEARASFIHSSSSWKVAVLLGLVLNPPISAREFVGRAFPSEALFTLHLCPEFPPRFPQHCGDACRGALHALRDVCQRLSSRILHEAALCSQYSGEVSSELVSGLVVSTSRAVWV